MPVNSKMVCQCTLAAIGYVGLTWAAYKVLTALYNIFFPYFMGSADLKKKAGADWAVVTGSTDGIGKAYAFDLARRGFNLLLVSRTQSKLEETKKEINEKYSNVSIKTFSFDFSTGDFSAYTPLIEEMKKVEVGILVNNVGMSYEYPDELHKIEGGLERIANITTINTLPPTVLTGAVLPQMVARKNGVIINVASSASYHDMAYWAVYSATKKYVTWLSSILRKEYAHQGITIQTICPMLVATKMSKVRKTNFFTPDGAAFAKSALNTVGVVDETTGYFSHQLQAEILFSLPSWLFDIVANKNSMATKKAALRKKEKAAKEQ